MAADRTVLAGGRAPRGVRPLPPGGRSAVGAGRPRAAAGRLPAAGRAQSPNLPRIRPRAQAPGALGATAKVRVSGPRRRPDGGGRIASTRRAAIDDAGENGGTRSRSRLGYDNCRAEAEYEKSQDDRSKREQKLRKERGKFLKFREKFLDAKRRAFYRRKRTQQQTQPSGNLWLVRRIPRPSLGGKVTFPMLFVLPGRHRRFRSQASHPDNRVSGVNCGIRRKREG